MIIVSTALLVVLVGLVALNLMLTVSLAFGLAKFARAVRFRLGLTTEGVTTIATTLAAVLTRGSGDSGNYTVRHGQDVLYEGADSDKAYAAWMELEHNHEKYPREHEYVENGRRRGHRPAKPRKPIASPNISRKI